MSTYDYRCAECGHEFEEFQPITSDPLVKCPNCGKNSLRRILGGGGGMIFKGKGFYLTDYKKSAGEKKSPSTPDRPSEDSKPKDKPEKESGKKTPPDKTGGKEK